MSMATIAIHRVGNAAELRLVEGDISILSALYAFDVTKASPEELLVTYEPFLEDPIARVREVIDSLNRNGALYALTTIEGDTFTIVGEGPLEPNKIDEVTIDLKWSLWSSNVSSFEERCPEALERMRKAFEGNAPAIKAYTAPAKEIRYGSALVTRGRAEVDFSFEWDAPYELADFVNEHLDPPLTDEEHEKVSEQIASWLSEHHDSFRESADLTADTFEELLASIDAVEERLLAAEKELSAEIKEFEKSLADWIRDLRANPQADE